MRWLIGAVGSETEILFVWDRGQDEANAAEIEMV